MLIISLNAKEQMIEGNADTDASKPDADSDTT